MNYSNTFDHKYFLQCFLHEIPQSTMFSVRMLTAVPCMMSDMESDLATSYPVLSPHSHSRTHLIFNLSNDWDRLVP